LTDLDAEAVALSIIQNLLKSQKQNELNSENSESVYTEFTIILKHTNQESYVLFVRMRIMIK
jgi:hypothetical protein